MIPINEFIFVKEARNGVYCCYPYEGHKKGCPNFPKCIQNRPKNFSYFGYKWFAVVEEFDLKTHAEKMKSKHPDWSERQCRCLLYWQGGVRKRLREKAEIVAKSAEGSIILDIPEAYGINVFETMAIVGVVIDRKPNIVRKVMLIGKPNRKLLI
jgi:hypothetical protein